MSGSVAPVGSAELLGAVKEQVRTARLRAHCVVNTELLRSPTVGILLCAGRNDAVVHYALANTTAPMAIAGYTSSPVDPDQLNLPRRADLEAILVVPVTGRFEARASEENT